MDADIIAMILPGSVSQIIKVLLAKPNKESQVILTKAFDVLDTVITLTLSDRLNSSLITVVTSLEDLAVIKTHPKTQPRNKYSESRTEAWLNATKGQLGAGLGSLLPLRSHAKPSIRKQYAVLAGDIVTSCAGTLDNCTGTMLELLILFYNDEDEGVANVSRSYVNRIAASNSAAQALSHLKASLRAWIVAFPRIMLRRRREPQARHHFADQSCGRDTWPPNAGHICFGNRYLCIWLAKCIAPSTLRSIVLKGETTRARIQCRSRPVIISTSSTLSYTYSENNFDDEGHDTSFGS